MGSTLAMNSGDFSTPPRGCHDPSANGALARQGPPDLEDPADEELPLDEAERHGLLLVVELGLRDGDLVPLQIPVDGELEPFGQLEPLLESPGERGVAVHNLLRLADDLPPVFQHEGPLHPGPG